jgi:hypothetical protein
MQSSPFVLRLLCLFAAMPIAEFRIMITAPLETILRDALAQFHSETGTAPPFSPEM